MAFLPPIPRRYEDIIAWARKITDYLQQITPRSGGRVKVSHTPVGATISDKPDLWQPPYHFQVVQDYDYTPAADERRVKIRGGLFRRSNLTNTALEITAPVGASPDFGAAGGPDLDDYAVADSTIDDGEVWEVYLGLYDATNSELSGIAHTALFAAATKGTVGSPPNFPDDPEATGGDDIRNWSRPLARVTNASGLLTIVPHWRAGNIGDHMMQPDTQQPDSSGSVWVESMDYVSAGVAETTQRGLLQDRQAHEILVEGVGVTQYDNDFAIMYFDHQTTGATQKKYARIDSHDADAWSSPNHKSLEVYGSVVQIYDMHTMDDEEDDDSKALYVHVEATTGDSYVEYRWPVTIDDGIGSGQRPRNGWDGSALPFDIIDAIAAGSATGSYGSGSYSVRNGNSVENASLAIAASTSGNTYYIAINNVDADDITWGSTGGPHHDQTDGTASGSAHASWGAGASLSNPEHDDAYWQCVAAGRAEAGDFLTSGYCHSTEFQVTGAGTEIWNATTFSVTPSGVASIVAGGSVTITGAVNVAMTATAGAYSVASGTTYTVTSGGAAAITAASGNAGLFAAAGQLDLVAGAGNANLSATGIVNVDGATCTIDTSAGDVTITPGGGGGLDLAAGVYEHLGVPGVTIADGGNNIFSGGILTNIASYGLVELEQVRVVGLGGVHRVRVALGVVDP